MLKGTAEPSQRSSGSITDFESRRGAMFRPACSVPFRCPRPLQWAGSLRSVVSPAKAGDGFKDPPPPASGGLKRTKVRDIMIVGGGCRPRYSTKRQTSVSLLRSGLKTRPAGAPEIVIFGLHQMLIWRSFTPFRCYHYVQPVLFLYITLAAYIRRHFFGQDGVQRPP